LTVTSDGTVSTLHDPPDRCAITSPSTAHRTPGRVTATSPKPSPAGALLLEHQDWERATAEFAKQRAAYYDVLRAYDRWTAQIDAEWGPEADRRRELNAAAREADPTLGGFATLEACGPDGLVADDAARRRYFGE
jgi:hypothetical protein